MDENKVTYPRRVSFMTDILNFIDQKDLIRTKIYVHEDLGIEDLEKAASVRSRDGMTHYHIDSLKSVKRGSIIIYPVSYIKVPEQWLTNSDNTLRRIEAIDLMPYRGECETRRVLVPFSELANRDWIGEYVEQGRPNDGMTHFFLLYDSRTYEENGQGFEVTYFKSPF